MAQCYGAIPCWIMPTWRVAEQLPGEVGTFDLVIMDEASQSDIREIPALLRGKKILVVGDDKQVSPTAAFIENAKIDRLEHNYLSEQPFKTLLLPGSSLYDLAKVMFPDKLVMLREHFRCVEPIIRFSMGFYPEPLVRCECRPRTSGSIRRRTSRSKSESHMASKSPLPRSDGGRAGPHRRRLVAQGYRVTPQVGAAGYRIDIVVEGAWEGASRWNAMVTNTTSLNAGLGTCVANAFSSAWAGGSGAAGLPVSRSTPTDAWPICSPLSSDWASSRVNQRAGRFRYTLHVEARSEENDQAAPPTTASSSNRFQSEGIAVGDRVVVQYLDDRKQLAFSLTRDRDDVLNGFLSSSSPLGAELLGKSEDDEIEIGETGRARRILILKVERLLKPVENTPASTPARQPPPPPAAAPAPAPRPASAATTVSASASAPPPATTPTSQQGAFPFPPQHAPKPGTYSEGDEVAHPKYGTGNVERMRAPNWNSFT